MYLKELIIRSGDLEVRKVHFKKGLNLIVGRIDENGSSNNLGKTTLIRSLNFCLGGKLKEFYEDEESKVTNKTVKDFITVNQLVFTLHLCKDFYQENLEDFTISRHITYDPSKKNPIKVVNKINDNIYSNDKKYNHELKVKLFHSDIEKPSFRQLIPKFVRRSDLEISNILKYLYKGTSDGQYELIHFFLFGFNLPKILEDKSLIEKKRIDSEKKYKSLRSIIPEGLEQKLSLLRNELEIKSNQRDMFKIDEKYDVDSSYLTTLQEKINNLTNIIQNLSLDNNILEDRLITIENNSFKEDTKTIGYMYEEAKLLNILVHSKFEQTVNFHNSMIDNERTYLKERINRINQEVDLAQKSYREVTHKYNIILEKLGKMGSLRQYTELNSEIEKLSIVISSIETQLNQLEDAVLEKNKYELELKSISEKLENNIDNFKRKNIEIFNNYFSQYSNIIYGELWYVTFSSNEENTSFKFNINSVTQNVGSGKKQMLVAAFDTAYMAYIQDYRIDLPFPRFATQDKVEIIAIEDLKKIKNIVELSNGQLILPIIEDKYCSFDDAEIEDTVILELSSEDKFFNIEKFEAVKKSALK